MIEITVHYLDNGLVSYTGEGIHLDLDMKCFLLSHSDESQTIIPLSSCRYIKIPRHCAIIGGENDRREQTQVSVRDH